MSKLTIADWSATAASNTDLGASLNTSGTGLVSTADDSFREMMAQVSRYNKDLAGVGVTVGGTADAITITVNQPWSAIADGQIVGWKNTGGPNTTAVTLTVTPSGGAAFATKDLVANGGAALVGGELLDNAYVIARYDSTLGDYVVINGGGSSAKASTTDILTGTDAAKLATSDAIAALWEKGSDVASAGTISLGEGGFFHITGTTTITDIDFATAKNGRGAWLEFDGILTLTHNATTLNLPGGANITTAAGDRAYVVQDNADNVHVMVYVRAAASATGGLEYVATQAASASATILFDSSTSVTFAADYDYIIKCTSVKPSADGQIQLQFGTGGTPTYQTATYTTVVLTANASAAGVATNSITSAVLVSPATIGGASAGEYYSAEIIIDEPAANDYHAVTSKGTSSANDGSMQTFQCGGRRTAQEVVTGIRLQPSTGSFTTGTFTLYRRKIR